jgi:hypothetical protein
MGKVLYLRRRVLPVIIAGCFGVLFWVGLFYYMSAKASAPSPRVTSVEDMIAYYGGCDAYLKAMRENDAILDRIMAEADLPGWRESAAERWAERRYETLKALRICREMDVMMKEAIHGTPVPATAPTPAVPPSPGATGTTPTQRMDDETFRRLLSSSP